MEAGRGLYEIPLQRLRQRLLAMWLSRPLTLQKRQFRLQQRVGLHAAGCVLHKHHAPGQIRIRQMVRRVRPYIRLRMLLVRRQQHLVRNVQELRVAKVIRVQYRLYAVCKSVPYRRRIRVLNFHSSSVGLPRVVRCHGDHALAFRLGLLF